MEDGSNEDLYITQNVFTSDKISDSDCQLDLDAVIELAYSHRIKISNRRATQRCNVSSFFMQKYAVYWPEGSLQADVTRKNVCRQISKLGFRPLA
jgi:hypothetical protein